MDAGSLEKMAGLAAGAVERGEFADVTAAVKGAVDAKAAERAAEAKEMVQELSDTRERPTVVAKKQENLKKPTVRKASKAAAPGAPGRARPTDKDVDKQAKEFNKSHPELEEKDLKGLYGVLKDNETPESLLQKIQAKFTNKSQASNVLTFLLNTLKPNDPLRKVILEAKTQFDAAPENREEIEKGHAITGVARELATKGHGEAKKLDALLTNIVAEQSEPANLCQQLSEHCRSSETELQKLLQDLMKIANPALRKPNEGAYLGALCTEIRTLQSILGVFTAMKNSMSTIKSSFKQAEIPMPAHITVPHLFKHFMEMVKDSRPSPSKIRDLVNRMAGRT